MTVHRARHARAIEPWSASGSERALDAANSDNKFNASLLRRPPVSTPAVSSRKRELVRSSGHVVSLSCRPRPSATPGRSSACGCGRPSVRSGETMVASMARGIPWCIGSPVATTSMLRPSWGSTGRTPASCEDAISLVQTLRPLGFGGLRRQEAYDSLVKTINFVILL